MIRVYGGTVLQRRACSSRHAHSVRAHDDSNQATIFARRVEEHKMSLREHCPELLFEVIRSLS